MEFATLTPGASPKKLALLISLLSGFAPLPPIHSLGFHFSKWESISADLLMERSTKFTNYNLPVDTLWEDIEHTSERKYFTFNPKQFPESKLE